LKDSRLSTEQSKAETDEHKRRLHPRRNPDLGVLAAIVVPQFSSATDEAQLSALRGNLHIFRKQIELYIQHDSEKLPAVAGESGTDFIRRLTFNNRATVRVGGDPAGANTDGWRFDPATGQIQPDDNHDGNGDSTPDHIGL